MSKRNLPILFTTEEIHQKCREYCQNTTKTIVTADDMVWLFPGRSKIKRSSKDFAPWVLIKRDVSNFMRSSEMSEWWVQCSPKSPHSQRQWKRRKQPLHELHVPAPRTCGRMRNTDLSRSISLIGNRNNRYCNGDPEPWADRLARYRKVCESLIVVENGGSSVKEYLTVQNERSTIRNFRTVQEEVRS